jgi:hypothetical protein
MFDRLQAIWVGSGSATNAVQNKLLREATMQMVLFHFSNLATPYRTQWQGWQAQPTSYPSLLRRVAIANGSGQATPQLGMTPGMKMLQTTGFLAGQVAGRNDAYALPGTTIITNNNSDNNIVFRYQKPFSLSGNWHNSYCNPAWSYFDQAPGSFRRTSADAEKEGGGSLKSFTPSQTFMATISALDVRDAGSYNSPNLGYNVQQQIPVKNLPDRAKYAFDAYFSADNVNEPHVQVTNG